jgi:ketosteroid isomerase-like protein
MQNNGPDVIKLFDTWIAGYDKGSLEQVMSVFDPSVVYIPPCYPPQNFSELRKWFATDFERSGARPHWTFKVVYLESSGDLAVAISEWAGYSDFGNSRLQAEVHRFRSVDVFKNGKDGWKIVRTVNGPNECGATIAKPSKKKPKPRKKK